MTHLRSQAFVAAMSVMALALSAAGAAAQTSFSIDPLMIQFDAETKNEVLTLTNASTKDVRFEIRSSSPRQATRAPPSSRDSRNEVRSRVRPSGRSCW